MWPGGRHKCHRNASSTHLARARRRRRLKKRGKFSARRRRYIRRCKVPSSISWHALVVTAGALSVRYCMYVGRYHLGLMAGSGPASWPLDITCVSAAAKFTFVMLKAASSIWRRRPRSRACVCRDGAHGIKYAIIIWRQKQEACSSWRGWRPSGPSPVSAAGVAFKISVLSEMRRWAILSSIRGSNENTVIEAAWPSNIKRSHEKAHRSMSRARACGWRDLICRRFLVRRWQRIGANAVVSLWVGDLLGIANRRGADVSVN